MENKQPFKAAVYMRVGNAAQITHKEQKDFHRELAEKNGYKVEEQDEKKTKSSR